MDNFVPKFHKMVKRLYFEDETTIVKKRKGWVEIEMDFTQIYDCINDIAPFINSPTSFKLMFYLLSNEAGKYNGIISSKEVYERFNQHQQSKIPLWTMTYRTFLNCMDELKESKALTKVGRGHYYFNPHIVWKADKNERIKFIQDEHKEGKTLSHNPNSNKLTVLNKGNIETTNSL